MGAPVRPNMLSMPKSASDFVLCNEAVMYGTTRSVLQCERHVPTLHDMGASLTVGILVQFFDALSSSRRRSQTLFNPLHAVVFKIFSSRENAALVGR